MTQDGMARDARKPGCGNGGNGGDGGGSGRRVAFVTLGCAKNEVDTAMMEEGVLAAGFRIEDDPLQADAVVVNTCAFIVEATEESIDAVLALRSDLDEAGRRVPVIVAGCLASRYGDDLAEALSEADAFLPCAREGELAGLLEGLLPSGDAMPCRLHPNACGRHANDGVSRYVKISDGCDRFCSFCAIPYIRGGYRSFPQADIEARVAAEIATGAQEIVLIAQDTGRWGEDLPVPSTLARLLSALAEAHPHTRLRFLYTEPLGVTDELIEAVASHSSICPYFDIPIQHTSESLLARMNRTGSAGAFLEMYRRIRTAIPQAILRTTLIAGFPGETEEDFEGLMDFLEEAQLDYVGVFPYSQEEGTAAAELPSQIPHDVKISRAQQIRDYSDAVSASKIRARIGETVRVLIEGTDEDGHRFGRTEGQAPEVDGITFVDVGETGEFRDVIIEDTMYYDMEGTAR